MDGRRTRPWLCAVLVVCAGCGPSSFGDFRNQLVERSCARLIRCGRLAASETAYCPVPSELAPIIADSAGDLDVDVAVSRGWLSFDSDGAQSCLDAVGGSACDDAEAARTTGLACHHVIGPGIAVGRDCPEDPTCIGGVCANASTCGGQCVAYPAPGQPCVSDGGISCDPTVEYCAAGVCAYHQEAGGKCAADGDCAFGLSCNSGKCGNLQSVADGAACDATHPCDAGSACTGGLCQLLAQNGQLCDGSSGPAPCADGLVCRVRVLDAGTSSVCQPPSDTNGHCIAVTSESGCASDEVCAPADGGAQGGPGSCQSSSSGRAVGPGQVCSATIPCGPGLTCGTSGSCAFLGGRGAYCMAATDCLAGLECVTGVSQCDRPGCAGSIAVDAGAP